MIHQMSKKKINFPPGLAFLLIKKSLRISSHVLALDFPQLSKWKNIFKETITVLMSLPQFRCKIAYT